MRTRCRHGDLAVIIKDEPELLEANLGRIVKVHGPARLYDGPPAHFLGRLLWAVEAVTPEPMPFLDPESGRIEVDPGGCDILHRDDWLLPIRPRRWSKIQKATLAEGEGLNTPGRWTLMLPSARLGDHRWRS